MAERERELDLEEELSEIPPEYQEVFRETIEQELAESEQADTDAGVLAYLRERRKSFRRGAFIRPDGRSGMLALDPDAMYEQALPALVQDSLNETGDAAERRRTLLKVGALAIVTLLLLFLVFRGRDRDEPAVADAGTPATQGVEAGTVAPTAPLPEVTGADDTLQTIGGLGGALTIGRPSAIELRYGRTEETIALAIDPSKPTPRGELRYDEAAMLSDNPVAVWLFGTVLNYAVGVPDSMVRNLEAGDRLTLSTDTGAALRFVVAETGQGSNHEAGRLLSQNRIGLTLFALPAVAEDDVAFAFASYDVAGEEEQGQPSFGVGERFSLGDVESVAITTTQFAHTGDGSVRVVLGGTARLPAGDGEAPMLSLATGGEQTAAVPLTPDAAGAWQAGFTLPGRVAGLPLFAEFRRLPGAATPGGALAAGQLGEIPRLSEQLQTAIGEAWWDEARGQAVIVLSVRNPGEGAVYVPPDFIQLATTGGDDDGTAPDPVAPGRAEGEGSSLTWQAAPPLPALIGPGETITTTVSATMPAPASSSLPQIVQLQIGADLWQVSPGSLVPGALSTGQPPANGSD